MVRFVVLLILVAAAAVFVPPAIEGTPNVCSAFERKMGTLVQAEAARLPPALANDPRLAAMLKALRDGGGNGMLAEAYLHDRFPQLPPVAGCTAAYWKVTFDPDIAQYATGKLPL